MRDSIPYPRYRALFSPDRPAVFVRLLRSRNAALVLCFLQESFKAGSYAPVLSGEKLNGLLADFLEVNQAGDEEGDLTILGLPYEDQAAQLLKKWIRDGFLTLYTDEHGADQHTLTPELENVLDWVHALLDKPAHVGTESRFLDILHKLRELAQNTDTDWRTKLTDLEKQRSDLDKQIRELKLSKTVVTYDDVQIAERYQNVSGLARGLLRDFREVENNFRAITQEIYKQQSAAGHTKGSLLGLALDALDALRDTPQGRSFEAFYQHLTDPRQKAELDALVQQLFGLLEARGLAAGDGFLRKVRFYLHGEGKKVNESFHALARKLEKIVSEKNLRERRRSLALIQDIRRLAFEVMDAPPEDAVFLEIDGRAEYQASETKEILALEERESSLVPRQLAVAQQEETDFVPLVGPRVVDRAVLLANIEQLLRSRPQVSLRQVVDTYALQHGLAELMTYGSIAATSDKHVLNDARTEVFVLGPGRACEFPEIIFGK
ncbi:DUF3375 domain-containing protein [Hymenobacter setariae]|uniref:DUF3375 domain-containing protein n=1 Tax=Hymenobacter setariae TaxID=2594794 RepID=A0A558BZA1_9BACT|nr:DUF3375 family protein [Hymenobacter setariae]TVT41854.1 DUF3375 domain-containing protein [Hymenobacter setariae]